MDFPTGQATNIERELAERERSISWLARKAEISPSYAWKMVRGLRPLTEDFKAAAARELGLPADELFADIPHAAAS